MRRRKEHMTAQEILDPMYIRGNGSYRYDMPERAYKLALLGYTDAELAIAFGIDGRTIREWKERNPEFAEMLEKGRALADAEVVNSLYKCATGYTYVRQWVSQKTGKVTEIIEYKHPEAWACVKWLQMRQRERWNYTNKVEADISIEMKKEDLKSFTDEELEAIEKLGLMKQLVENNREN